MLLNITFYNSQDQVSSQEHAKNVLNWKCMDSEKRTNTFVPKPLFVAKALSE